MASKFNRKAPITRRKSKVKGDTGLVVMIFVGLILAIVLLSSVADTENAATNTITITNETVTLPADGGTLELTGRDHVSTTSVVNASDATQDYSTNVTLSDGLGTDGTKTVILTLDGTFNGTAINGTEANVTYVANPDGFVPGSSGTVLSLVLVFGALAALFYVVVVLYRKGTFGLIMFRRR